MAQVILIHDNREFIDILKINITTYLAADVIPLNYENAVKLLDILPEIDLIIVKDKIEKENTALNIINHLRNTELEPIVIVMGNPDALIKDLCIPIADLDWQGVIAAATKALKIDSSKFKERAQRKYAPLSCDYFLHLDSTPCDIFIRIKKTPTEFQFIKRFNAMESFSADEIQKYIDRGIKHFYVQEEFKEVFANLISNKQSLKLEENIPLMERMGLLSDSFNLAYHLIKDTGLLTSTVQLVDSVVGVMLNSIKEIQKENLAAVLEQILQERHSFAYRYSFITAIMAVNTLESTFGNKWTEEQKRVLCFVSFFHDITLKGKRELLVVNSQEELVNADLSNEDKNLISNHALEASKLCLDYPNYPTDADVIIREHHMVSSGTGFLTDFKNLLHPLSMVFYVSEKFSLEIIKHQEINREFIATKIIDKMKSDPSNTNLTHIIQALRSRLVN